MSCVALRLVLDDDAPSVNVRVWTGSGSRFSTHELTGETTRVRLPLRGAGDQPTVRIAVVTGTGYHGSVESAPVDEPIAIVLEPRK